MTIEYKSVCPITLGTMMQPCSLSDCREGGGYGFRVYVRVFICLFVTKVFENCDWIVFWHCKYIFWPYVQFVICRTMLQQFL